MSIGETKSLSACFDWNYEKADCSYKEEIEVTKCDGDYYVYKLPSVQTCHARYCAVQYFLIP